MRRKRLELYKTAEKVLLNEEVAIVPLQYYDRTLLVKDGVSSTIRCSERQTFSIGNAATNLRFVASP